MCKRGLGLCFWLLIGERVFYHCAARIFLYSLNVADVLRNVLHAWLAVLDDGDVVLLASDDTVDDEGRVGYEGGDLVDKNLVI